jgi:hypothetical protein
MAKIFSKVSRNWIVFLKVISVLFSIIYSFVPTKAPSTKMIPKKKIPTKH